ncbi:hypothetical protein F3Y22_tig00113722pilonHSYRG00283 [Hibiscus syriacus]|uniref:NB-ARC domain-containing protein n=1 Tax=Hibiscus syriacus TaxID=106335 RepID=A0A6A2WNB5_HIBSY|nr:hypothetical protein F3Y22_tig00113722pilonHSYRG00283 [Hibiscus syriacus]
MDSSTNQNQSDGYSKNQSLYDEFLKDVNLRTPLLKARKEEDEYAHLDLSEEEKQRFLKRIYEPPRFVQAAGVIGMLGVGKTALCRLILDEKEVKQRYFPRFLITLSESDEPRSMVRIVERMVEHLEVEDETINSISKENKLPGLLYALHLRLDGKKFLIVTFTTKS